MSDKLNSLLLAMIVLMLSGCITPLRESQPVFSVQDSPAANSTNPTTSSVVRGQSPYDNFGGRTQRPLTGTGPTSVQNAGYYQSSTGPIGSGQPSGIQPVQYNAPAAPGSLWGLNSTPANAGIPNPASPYAAQPPAANFPAPSGYTGAGGYPGSGASTVPPASFPGQSTALWGQGTPAPGTFGTFGAPVGPPPGSSTGVLGLPTDLADIVVNVQEAQTGKFMVGAAVNSDAGVTGQIVIDERNFDWRAFPRSFDDLLNGGAFRGAGQGLRIEALPGSQVQRYMVQFTEPYLFDTRISMNLSGYLFDRQFFDWDEQRLGGRFGLGYRVTPDMSLAASLRIEEVKIRRPRIPGVPELDAVVGRHDLYSGRFTLTQDTRDIPFQPTQGYYFQAGFEQTFGTFDYPRFDLDMRRYFLLAERPDGSGRHVLGFSNKLGISGEQTPIFENYYAGGYSTMRGFDFRRASPQSMGVTIGGRFQILGSAEYLFPITADDMVKGVAFVDYGTVEEDVKIEAEDFRVAVGLGLRVNIPAMGPAPIALDFAVPIAREETDEIRGFSFFMGVSR